MNPIVRQIFLTTLLAAIRGCRESSHSCAQCAHCAVQHQDAKGRISDLIGTERGRGHDKLSNQGAGARVRTWCESLSKRQIPDRQSLSERSRLLRILGTGFPERTRSVKHRRGVTQCKDLLAGSDAQNELGRWFKIHALFLSSARRTALSPFIQTSLKIFSISASAPQGIARAPVLAAGMHDLIAAGNRSFFQSGQFSLYKDYPHEAS
jgi:hypothetical protein